MAISTAGDLVNFALRIAGVTGVGQTPSAEDSNDALTTLAAMVAGWQRKRWLVWDLIDASVVSTGAMSYVVGPAGDIAIARPDRLESAFVRLINTNSANQIDYPLSIIEAREDYNAIPIKTLVSFPSVAFYDSAYPTGSLYIWPIPLAGQFAIHIAVKAPLQPFAALSETLALPPEYIEALIYNLATRICMNYGMQVQPGIAGAARQALNTLRMANTQVATLGMPAGLGGRRTSGGVSMVGQGLSRAFVLDGGSVLS